MSTIKINNSYSELTGFSEDEIKAVRKVLTYTDEEVVKEKQMIFAQIQRAKIRRQTGYISILRQKFKDLGPENVCWLDSDNKFPTGLIHLVKNTLENVKYKVIDERIKPEPYNVFRWNNVPFPLRYYQEEATDAFIKSGSGGVIQLACRTGKTRVACQIIKELGVNTLFVVTSSALRKQAENVLTLAFGSKNVQVINTDTIKKDKKLKPIRIVTIHTLHSLNKQNLADRVLGDVDLLILDECHHSGSESFTGLLNQFGGIYYRLGLSGTYMRNDSKTLDLWGVCGKIIYDYSATKAIKDKYLIPIDVNIVKLKGSPDRQYQKEYRENYGSPELMEAIKNIIVKIPESKQILILVDRKDDCGHIIYDYLTNRGISCTYINGDNKSAEIDEAIDSFNKKDIRILLASTVLGEGIDLQSTDHLIMARGGKSEIAMTQAAARAMTLFEDKLRAYVWDFRFEFCKYLPRHTDIRIETYMRQFAAKIVYV